MPKVPETDRSCCHVRDGVRDGSHQRRLEEQRSAGLLNQPFHLKLQAQEADQRHALVHVVAVPNGCVGCVAEGVLLGALCHLPADPHPGAALWACGYEAILLDAEDHQDDEGETFRSQDVHVVPVSLVHRDGVQTSHHCPTGDTGLPCKEVNKVQVLVDDQRHPDANQMLTDFIGDDLHDLFRDLPRHKGPRSHPRGRPGDSPPCLQRHVRRPPLQVLMREIWKGHGAAAVEKPLWRLQLLNATCEDRAELEHTWLRRIPDCNDGDDGDDDDDEDEDENEEGRRR